MEELIDVIIAEILVHDTMDEHQVLNECSPHWKRSFDLLSATVSIRHLESELALPVDTVSSGLVILIQD